jgi:HNH endonuclease
MNTTAVFSALTYHPLEGSPETGYFKWKKRRGVQEGRWAGTVSSHGYRVIAVGGKMWREHRIVYLVNHGTLPYLLDHIDGDKLNNALDNLREATQAQNMRNAKKHKNSSSSYIGVTRSKGKFWVAQISLNQRNTILYHGQDEIEAAKAYNEAALKHFGEFARLNSFTDGKLTGAEVIKQEVK